jgi:hypothetical protein
VATTLSCPPAEAWEAVQRPALLAWVSAPLVHFVPRRPPAFPRRWAPGDYEVGLRLFGLLPLGGQRIRISAAVPECTPTDERYGIRDDGAGQLARRWDHRITITGPPGGPTRYTDDVDVAAGPLTPLVWAFAQLFYRWRQSRWRALVARGLASLDMPG